jgi:hypothetical protein
MADQEKSVPLPYNGMCHVHDDGWGNCEACYKDFQTLRQQSADIHAFIEGLAGALNNPMVRAMMPPNMRGFIGGN